MRWPRRSLGAPGVGRNGLMAMDAYRDGDHVVIALDVPGVDPDSIDLTVDKNVLNVTAERNWKPAEGQEEIIVSERRQGKFTRQMFLGDSLEADAIEANYDRGVLTLTVPVAEQAKPRRVNISTGGSSQAIPANATSAEEDGRSDAANLRWPRAEPDSEPTHGHRHIFWNRSASHRLHGQLCRR